MFCRHVAPTQYRLLLGFHYAFKQLFDLFALACFRRQEDHAGSVVAKRGKVDLQWRALRDEEGVWGLDGDSCTITSILPTAAGAAMLKVDQNFDTFLNNGVRFATFEIDNKAHTAGIMLEARSVQTLSGRRRASLTHLNPSSRQRSLNFDLTGIKKRPSTLFVDGLNARLCFLSGHHKCRLSRVIMSTPKHTDAVAYIVASPVLRADSLESSS